MTTTEKTDNCFKSKTDCLLSIAISLKRIADAVAGDDKNSGIHRILLDLAERPQ